jgi:holo-[acyl-carrier protein] synthase
MKPEILTTFDKLTANRQFSVGNDLVFVPDFRASCTDLFKNKVYTPGEHTYCKLFDDSILRYASTWAAKEAVYKAIKQLDDSPLSWKHIEIVREKIAGRPCVLLENDPERFIISLTISHDGDYVWAAALVQLNATDH